MMKKILLIMVALISLSCNADEPEDIFNINYIKMHYIKDHRGICYSVIILKSYKKGFLGLTQIDCKYLDGTKVDSK